MPGLRRSSGREPTVVLVLVHGAFAASFAAVVPPLLDDGLSVVVPAVPNRSYALAEGESLGELQGRFPDSDLATALVYRPYPVAGQEDGTDVYVDVDRSPAVFAEGVDPGLARVLAVSQRPLAGAAFGEPASVAAWQTRPAWGLVSSHDRTINLAVERFGYERAGMTVREVESSHLVMLAHPEAVVERVREAVGATSV